MGASEPQCAHLTKKGRRCKNAAVHGRLFCRAHDPDLETSPRWAAFRQAEQQHPEIFGKERE